MYQFFFLPFYGFNNLSVLHVLKAALAERTYEVCLACFIENEPSTSFRARIKDVVLLISQSLFKIPEKPLGLRF